MGRNVENGRFEILDADRCSDLGLVPDLYSNEDRSGLCLFEDSDASDYGEPEADNWVADILTKGGRTGPHDALQALYIQEGNALPFPAQRKKGGSAKILKSVELADFEDGAERWAACAIIGAVNHFFDHIADPEKVADVAAWLFADSSDPASFTNCCEVNQTRPDVLRMRIQFELWRKGKRAKKAFQCANVQLPEFILQKVMVMTGTAGLSVANRLWRHPGIEADQLNETISKDERKALGALAEMYVASAVETAPYRWYLTGINPIQEAHDRSPNGARTAIRLDSRRRVEMSWSSRFA